ncbi:hypothetical protein EMCRGX_G004268 [Ephydatia muelleri]
MASSTVDAAVLQRTKDTLGKVIKKPPLTDKLLSRPPFRYLHDIIVEIVKSTGFFDGLYTSQELDSQNVQEKDEKVAFLQKAIDALSFVKGEVLKVRPSKIVSGQEPEKTNEFLQILAISIMKQCDSKEAVQKVLQGEKPTEALGKDKKKRAEKPAKSDKPDKADTRLDKVEDGEKVESNHRSDETEEAQRPDATEKPVKLDKADIPDKPDRPDKVERADKSDRPHKSDRADKPDKTDKVDKTDKSGKAHHKSDMADRPDKAEKPHKPDKPGKSDKQGKQEKPDKGDKTDISEKKENPVKSDKDEKHQKHKSDKSDKKKGESRPDKPDKPGKPDKSDKADKHDKSDKIEKEEKLDKADPLTKTTKQPSSDANDSKGNGESHTLTNGDKGNTAEDLKGSRKDLSGGARTRPKEPGIKDISSPDAQRKSKNGLQASSDKQLTDPAAERPKHQPSRRRTQVPGPQDNHTAEGEGSVQSGEGSGFVPDRPPSARGFRQPSIDEDPSQHPPSTTQLPEPDPSSVLPPPQPQAPPSEVKEPRLSGKRPSSPPPQPMAVPTGIVVPNGRPPSARPAPPKIVRRTSNEEPADARIPSGTAPPPPPVILDKHDDDNDDDDYVMKENLPPAPPPPSDPPLSTSNMKAEGALTQAIVATKERLEGGSSKAPPSTHAGNISEAQRKKERELVMKEVEKLQSSIQTLCKSANPLGRIMDYVQEDTDSMQKELEMWKAENARHSEAMKKEEGITEQELAPLRTELERLEMRISEQSELISATKANILKNDDKIQKMLNSIAFLST